MAGVDDVEFLRSVLILGAERPLTAGVADERVTFTGVADGGVLSGLEIRRALEFSKADLVAIVRMAGCLHPRWLREAIRRFDDPRVAAVTLAAGEAQDGKVLLAEGAATVLSLAALREVGGLWWTFDDGGLEQDAQWRLSARGWDVLVVSGLVNAPVEQRLGVDVRLALLANNLEGPSLERILPAMVVAAVTAPLREHGVPTRSLDLQRSPGGDDVGTLALPAAALEGTIAINGFAALLPRARDSRSVTQETRRLSDRMMAPLIHDFVEETWDLIGGERSLLEAAFPELAGPPNRILITTAADPSDGAGIGDWVTTVARRLAGDADVRCLAVTENRLLDLREGNWQESPQAGGDMASWADAVVFEGVYLRSLPWIAAAGVPIVVDCTHWPYEQDLANEYSGLTMMVDDHGVHAHLLNETIARADYALVADANSRDRMLGLMAGLKRLNALVYDEDQSLHNLVDVLDMTTLAQLVAWCRTPRKAVDLVRSFGRSAPEESLGSGLGRALHPSNWRKR